MTAPFLILDAYLDDLGGARNLEPRLGKRPFRSVRAAKGEPLPESAAGLAGILVTGSAASLLDPPEWCETAGALVRDAVERRVPFLGLCFGHQLLAWALAGDGAIVAAEQPELGCIDVERTKSHPLFDVWPSTFSVFASHRDEVRAGLPGFDNVARSAACAVQAMQVEDVPAYSVQFHPEMGAHEIEQLIRERSANDPQRAADLLKTQCATDELGDALLARFLELHAKD